MTNIFENRLKLKKSLKDRKRLFAGWVSYSNPSISETFSRAGFDFIAIDMEHSTISLEQGNRIIAACQSLSVPCFPRPVSHSNDYIKPLLESGADGLIIQMVNNKSELETLIDDIKYPPIGKRSYGVSRAQMYGFDFDEYIQNWNKTSSFIIQIESIEGVDNIDELVSHPEVDGVMIGPYDISGSLGVPGQLDHPKVTEASIKVIESCKKFGKSCGTQLNDPNVNNVQKLFDLGYTYVILGSDLFVLWKWADNMKSLMKSFK